MKQVKNYKIAKRLRRHKKIRKTLSGTEKTPRLSVFRSNKYIYAQLINDEKGATLASASSREIKGKKMLECAVEVGALIAKRAKEKNVSQVVFDRGGFLYAGKIKALADSARKAGLKF